MTQMQRARLIPVSGISGNAEAEQRATSALLAVMTTVRDFSNEVLGSLGASRAGKATVETFIEVEVKLPDGSKVRPDGLIRVSYGKSEWTALVEVKTGTAELGADQLNSYLVAAKEIGADEVISISNEIGIAGAHPTPGLKVRANSRIKVHHFSWSRLLSIAVQCKEHTGVEDPEQSWILGELIRYLEHPSSGVTSFDDMGKGWNEVRDGIRRGTLLKTSDALDDVATKWDELTRYLALRLSAETGASVVQLLPRSERDPKSRLQALRSELLDSGQMSSEVRVPDAASDMTVTADLRSGQIIIEASIDAPADKKGRGSVGWLTRQLRDAPPDLRIEAFAKNARTPASAQLATAASDSNSLIAEGQSDIRRFHLSLFRDAGKSRRSGGRSPGFITTVNSAVDEFYQLVLQDLTPWVRSAPKVHRSPEPDTFPQPGEPQPLESEPSSVPKRRADDLGSPVTSVAGDVGVEAKDELGVGVAEPGLDRAEVDAVADPLGSI